MKLFMSNWCRLRKIKWDQQWELADTVSARLRTAVQENLFRTLLFQMGLFDDFQPRVPLGYAWYGAASENAQMWGRGVRWRRSFDEADVWLMLPFLPVCRKPLKMFLEQIMLSDSTSST